MKRRRFIKQVAFTAAGMSLLRESWFTAQADTGTVDSQKLDPVLAQDWQDDVDVKFFYRLADGRYGRMTFSMIVGGHHFCMIDSVLNPSGSPNLQPAQ